MEFGVWGGMTERQRHALLKQHSEVDSWAKLFGHPGVIECTAVLAWIIASAAEREPFA